MKLPYLDPLTTVKMPFFANSLYGGLKLAASKGDGYTIALDWYLAYPDSLNFKVAYNIYISTNYDTLISEGVKYVAINPNATNVELLNFTPGQMYYFCVRATEYDPALMNLNLLPDGYPDAPGGIKTYPSGMLTSNISNTDLIIPITDIDKFPPLGVIKIGLELIQYTSIDYANSSLIASNRGIYLTDPRMHDTNGFDGYEYQDPIVYYFKGFENISLAPVDQEESKFDYSNEIYTYPDGYRDRLKDILTTDLSASDKDQQDFRSFDYSGWRRLDPLSILRGDCVGSYIGGEFYCADGYAGVGRQVRGVSVTEQNNQREEMLLETTGESVVLVRRMWKGKTCVCVNSSRETPEPRCRFCLGTGFQVGFEQFHNPRRSDGRILVRIDATTDDLEIQDAGLESKFIPNCWTMVYPAVKDRDFFIRFNEDGTEEYRYEILNVTRNRLFQTQTGAAAGTSPSGAQKFSAQRVRKTDPIYQFRAIRSTATIPTKLDTTMGILMGKNGVGIPHVHQIVVNEGTTQLFQVNQTTSVVQGHNHPIINGIVMPVLGHTHEIIL